MNEERAEYQVLLGAAAEDQELPAVPEQEVGADGVPQRGLRAVRLLLPAVRRRELRADPQARQPLRQVRGHQLQGVHPAGAQGEEAHPGAGSGRQYLQGHAGTAEVGYQLVRGAGNQEFGRYHQQGQRGVGGHPAAGEEVERGEVCGPAGQRDGLPVEEQRGVGRGAEDAGGNGGLHTDQGRGAQGHQRALLEPEQDGAGEGRRVRGEEQERQRGVRQEVAALDRAQRSRQAEGEHKDKEVILIDNIVQISISSFFAFQGYVVAIER